MNEKIFREKSLNRVKSPENLDDYIRVANPGVWLLLISVLILLAGACVWGIFGHIDSTVPVTVRVENGTVLCYVTEEDIASVRTGMAVKLAETEAAITSIGEKEDRGYTCSLTVKADLPDGFYEGKLVLERHKPLSFIFN